jgi:photosystem II stability/assembly factor-like uncharacterized protein/LysM repeat protein
MRRKILLVTVLFLTIFSGKVYAALTWSETQPAGNTTKSWRASGMTPDGTTMLVGVEGGRLYLSTNSGSSWGETQPAGAANKSWIISSISSTGAKMFVGAYLTRLYISINGASSWSETQPAGDANKQWHTGTMSLDGQTLVAGIESGRLYLSTNGGDTWAETQPAGNVNGSWYASSTSSNGQIILVGNYAGRLYLSTNNGSTWAETQPAGNANKQWSTSAMSSNGQILLAGEDSGLSTDGRLFLSSNGGTSWSEVRPAGNTDQRWISSSMSSNGTVILAGTHGGRLYISTDSGTTWSETQPVGSTNANWDTNSMSSDGTILLAGRFGGRIYLGSNPTPTPTPAPTATTTPASNNNNTDTCPGFVTCPNIGGSSNTSAVTISSEGPTGANGSLLIQPPVPGQMALSVSANNQTMASLLSPSSLIPVPWAQGFNLVGGVIQFKAVSAFNGYPVTKLDRPVIIMMSYDPSKLGGHSPQSLRIGWYNPATKRWQILNNNTVVKPGENLIANTISSMGYYTVLLPANAGYQPVLGVKTKNNVVFGEKVSCQSYTVQPGDSLWNIAVEKLGNGSAYTSILSSNKLSSTNLNSGQKLKIGC